MKKIATSLSAIFLVSLCAAQYFPNYDIEVKDLNDVTIKLPWVGGLNNPQFSDGDFNNDGKYDLLIFDRTGGKVLTFLNNGTPNQVDYVYAAEYEAGFPRMTDWALLEDYNCDNIPDIWAFTRGTITEPGFSIQVYRGFYDLNNTIQFAVADSALRYPSTGGDLNLFVSPVDIPAVVDVNGDGDVDVLTFQITGGYVMYFENVSKESGFGCDSLIFKKQDECWGDFYESGFRREDSLNVPCPFMLTSGGEDDASTRLHSGSTMVSWDNTGDGVVELMTGDISFTNLVYLVNCGTPDDANMCAQDTFFPSYDTPAEVFIFPAPFLVDVNNDGLRDLMVSPNAAGGSENYKCSWFYKNEGDAVTADFSYQSDSFVVGDMIDLGEGCYPVFFDADNDGLKDMILGNRGYFDNDNINIYIGQIAYYRNTGDAEHPQFKLITKDYAGIGSLGIKSICPTFGDLDGDGDIDMLTGQEDGTLLFFKNIASLGDPANFIFFSANYAGIDAGNYSTPQLADVNHDGLLDLVIGEQSGNLNYYENKGTSASPDFELQSSFWGEVKVNETGFINGYSAPFLYDDNDGNGYQLLVGGARGTLIHYTNIDNNLGGTFTKQDTVFSGIFAGENSTVSGSDVNDDGKIDMLVGNYRGGVTLYDSQLTGDEHFYAPQDLIRIYPNPASEEFLIEGMGENIQWKLFDLFGKERNPGQVSSEKPIKIAVNDLPPGIYFLQLSMKNQPVVKKIVVNR